MRSAKGRRPSGRSLWVSQQGQGSATFERKIRRIGNLVAVREKDSGRTGRSATASAS